MINRIGVIFFSCHLKKEILSFTIQQGKNEVNLNIQNDSFLVSHKLFSFGFECHIINLAYFIESAPYGFLFTSCKTLENE